MSEKIKTDKQIESLMKKVQAIESNPRAMKWANRMMLDTLLHIAKDTSDGWEKSVCESTVGLVMGLAGTQEESSKPPIIQTT